MACVLEGVEASLEIVPQGADFSVQPPHAGEQAHAAAEGKKAPRGNQEEAKGRERCRDHANIIGRDRAPGQDA